jgi:hypothetical protein
MHGMRQSEPCRSNSFQKAGDEASARSEGFSSAAGVADAWHASSTLAVNASDVNVMLCHVRLPARWQGLQAFGMRAVTQRRIVSHRIGAAWRGQEDGIVRARAHSVEDEVAD